MLICDILVLPACLRDPLLLADRDSLLDELVALGEQKQARTLRLSRQGVFATQFIDNTVDVRTKYLSKLPAGRSRGSTEFKATDFDLKKVNIVLSRVFSPVVLKEVTSMSLLMFLYSGCETCQSLGRRGCSLQLCDLRCRPCICARYC